MAAVAMTPLPAAAGPSPRVGVGVGERDVPQCEPDPRDQTVDRARGGHPGGAGDQPQRRHRDDHPGGHEQRRPVAEERHTGPAPTPVPTQDNAPHVRPDPLTWPATNSAATDPACELATDALSALLDRSPPRKSATPKHTAAANASATPTGQTSAARSAAPTGHSASVVQARRSHSRHISCALPTSS